MAEQSDDRCPGSAQNDNGKTQVGNPIDVATGNKYQEVTDFSTPGPNSLAFTRYYNSFRTKPGMLGYAWSTTFDRKLELPDLWLTRPNEYGINFRPSGSTYVPRTKIGLVWHDLKDLDLRMLKNSDNDWEVFDNTGIVETYSATDGRLMEIRWPNDYRQTITHNIDGRVSKVTDSLGRELNFTYVDGRLDTMTDPEGHVYKYSYSDISILPGVPTSQKILTKVTYPDDTPGTDTDNPTQTYRYEDTVNPFALTKILDENGNTFATFAYDSQGRATSSEHAGGAGNVTITYNTNGSRTITNALNKQAIYNFSTVQHRSKLTSIDGQASTNCPASTMAYTYNSNGNIASQTDWESNQTNFTRNALNQITQLTEAVGATEERLIRTSWGTDVRNRKPKQIREPGRRIYLSYDDNALLIQRKELDTTTHSVPYSTNGQTRIWQYAYSEDVGPGGSELPSAVNLDVVNESAHLGDLTGWTKGVGAFQALSSSSFYAGNAAYSELYQEIAIPSAYHGTVDANDWVVRLRWRQTTIGVDYGSVGLRFFDSQGVELGMAIESLRRRPSSWTVYNQWANVPLNTRKIRITLEAQRGAGLQNNVYFNTFSLTMIPRDPARIPVTIQNPGAETGNTSGWTNETGALGTQASGNPVSSQGARHFNGGSAALTVAYQDLAIPSGHHAAVDAGNRSFELDWRQRSKSGSDKGLARLVFLDGGGVEIGTPVASSASAPSGWTDREISGVLPSGTRTVRLKLEAQRVSGTPNDAYFDMIQAKLIRDDYVAPTPGMRHLVSIDGPRTDVSDITTFDYDADGNLIKVTNPLNQATEITAHDDAGRPTSITDPNGTVTELAYDERGRLVTRTVKDAGGDAVTTFEYDDVGQITGITLPGTAKLTYEYDAAHRLTAIANSLGERIEYTLDAMGGRTAEVVKASGGTIERSQTRVYDELGRLLESVGAASQKTLFAYDKNSNLASLTDGVNNQTQQAFDGLDRLVTITNPDLSTSSYGYDGQDNLDSVTDERSLATSYVQNGFGEVIQETSPDTGTTVYLRDAAGNVTRRTDARSVVTDYSYDALDRLTAISYPATPAEDVTYGYDDSTGGNEGVGRLTSIGDVSGSTAFTYDHRGNVTQEVRTIGTVAYTTAYAYDLADRLTEITYPSGRVVTYTRDTLGRVTGVTTKETSLSTPVAVASNIAYDPFGPLTALDHANGLDLTRGFDLDGRVTSIVTSDGLTPVQDVSYGYDAADGITTITDNLAAARSETFDYDNRRRLSDASGLYGDIDYVYDAVGNRTSRVTDDGVIVVTDSYTMASTSNRLSTASDGSTTRTLTYSAAGSVTRDDRGAGTPFDLGYNDENRLVSIEQGLTTLASYRHNALGERVSKTAGSATTHYHYDQDGRLIAESDGLGAAVREYLYLGDLPLAVVDHSGVGSPALYHVHADHLGTPRLMTDATKAVVWDAVFKPFGEVASLSGTAVNDNRFPGQLVDAVAGFHYNYFRDYDPTTGRYMQSDLIGLEGGLNTYGYVHGNPVHLIDPLGLEAVFGEFADSNECRATAEDVLFAAGITLSPIVCMIVPQLCTRAGLLALKRFLKDEAGGKRPDWLDPNKLHHIFGQARHNLDDLVRQFGSREQALKAIHEATETAARTQGLTGKFQTSVNVGGQAVTVRGIVINGAVRIGTAFKP